MISSTRQPDRLRHALLSQVASQLLRLLFLLGIGGWLARYLGPGPLGQLSYAMALIGVFAPLGGLGIKPSLASLLCVPNPLPGLVSTAFCLEWVGTALLCLCVLPWAFVARDPVIPALLALGVLANLFNSSEVYEVDLLNRQRGTLVGRSALIKVVVGALFTLGALIAKAPLLAFGAVQAVQNAVASMVLMGLSQASGLARTLAEFDAQTARALLRRGFPLMLGSFSVMLYMKSDQVMLEWFRGSEDVGQYSIAIRLAECLYFLPVILADTYFPRIANTAQDADACIQLRRFYGLARFLGLTMLLSSLLVLPWLVPIVFGSQYLPARAPLMCLGLANYAACTGCASGAWLNANGHIGFHAQRSAFGALMNLGLNLFMIPAYGMVGAAITTSLAQLASIYLFPLFNPATRDNTRLLMSPW